jgi:GNAT superfamily N-acetyltransferase
MTATEKTSRLETERLQPGMAAAFTELKNIYREAIPSSERKKDDVLHEMLARDDYEFRVARLAGDVVGFTIVKIFEKCDASLLEYMAVDRTKRGGGIGRQLFRDACSTDSIVGRYVLVEVEDEEEVTSLSEDVQRRRRKAFYRANGCREVAGLSYLMPTVSAQRPPRMNLLVYRRDLPEAIDSSVLRGWLAAIYAEVYRQSASDPRIERMLAPIHGKVSLQ